MVLRDGEIEIDGLVINVEMRGEEDRRSPTIEVAFDLQKSWQIGERNSLDERKGNKHDV